MLRGVPILKRIGCTVYGCRKKKPLGELQQKRNKDIAICINCTEENCKGYCDKFKRKSGTQNEL